MIKNVVKILQSHKEFKQIKLLDSKPVHPRFFNNKRNPIATMCQNPTLKN